MQGTEKNMHTLNIKHIKLTIKYFVPAEITSGHVKRAIRPPIRNFGYKFLTPIFAEINFG